MKITLLLLSLIIGINVITSWNASALATPTPMQIDHLRTSLGLPTANTTIRLNNTNNISPQIYNAYYYFLANADATALNGQSTSLSSVPFNYQIYTSDAANLFKTFYICPYVYTDMNDLEVLNQSYCNSLYMDGFNSGSAYSGYVPTPGRLIYPGANNISCLILSPTDNAYADCGTSYGTARINYTGTDFPVYRFWSNLKQHHFYTVDHVEKTTIANTFDTNTWDYEQISWFTKKFDGNTCSIGSPVYRFWSDQKQGHFFTISSQEKEQIQATYPSNVWRYEGVAYCAPPFTGLCLDAYAPVYRFWSDQKQGHFFTISSQEKEQIQTTYPSNVWRYEGIAFCAQQP